MEKLSSAGPDQTMTNIDRIAELFPQVITETTGEDGSTTRGIDFDLLRQELSDTELVDGPRERFRLDWPGKRKAMLEANSSIDKTLRPVRADSVDFDTTRNLFIEGDNLDVLKLLQDSYSGEVKLIYIDPPYNTGRDFIYDDDFSQTHQEYLERTGQVDEDGGRLVTNTESNGRFHSDWLSMMYPRLKLAKNLLKDDGVIFISIDDHEVHNLRELANEVFGESNFVAQIVWQKIHTVKNTAEFFSEDHEYVLCYARNIDRFKIHRLSRSSQQDARFTNPDHDVRGPWISGPIQARNYYGRGLYSIKTPGGRVIDGPPSGTYWRYSEEKLRELDADGRIFWGQSGMNVPRVKRFLSEMPQGMVPRTFWPFAEVGHTQDAKKTLLKYVPFEHTGNVFNSVKPVALMQRILQLATSPKDDDIVLDFFGGSATTAHAVLQQNYEDSGNRRFISVTIREPLEQPEQTFDTIMGMGLTRVRNVGAELISHTDVPSGFDVGFRLLTAGPPNMSDVLLTPDGTQQDLLPQLEESIEPDRSPEDLLFQVILDWGLELSVPIDSFEVAGHRVLDADNGGILACFDDSVSPEVVHAMADRKPLRAVFRDSAFAGDAERINVDQIFTELSPRTDVKTI